jgi:F-type H+-transporting ATPase subunit c
MRKLITVFLSTVAMLSVAGVAFAADASIDGSGLALICVVTSLSMAVAASGCGIAQSLGLKSACEGVARNPEASGKITVAMILGFAFIESLAIYALVINLILLFANPYVG